ncbi:class I SAM-dependent methyltransferase [Bacillus sp. JCM 19041]|uniref:class I SAM-dependent methyltransferase n=1 Tax=Bacillus sp. JCM 19041 TaxID=1460637 RepID=UPI0006D27C6B
MKQDYGEKEPSYYSVLNYALLHAIPPTAKRVLDVGCAGGYLGQAIKARTGGYVAGIELFSEAAKEAESRLDLAICGNVETDILPFQPEEFDAIVFGDVLEHMLDPSLVIRKMHPLLKAGGAIYASIPNVGHITIIEQLLSGTWTYMSAGLLDKTHFRFFTKKEIEKLFEENGFAILSIGQLMNTHERENQLIADLQMIGKKYQLPTDDLLVRATAYQYIVHAGKEVNFVEVR